jgi:hypothetical protein
MSKRHRTAGEQPSLWAEYDRFCNRVAGLPMGTTAGAWAGFWRSPICAGREIATPGRPRAMTTGRAGCNSWGHLHPFRNPPR